MKSIRCGSGLGDSLYLQGVVRHLVEQGHGLEVCSDWPDVFLPLEGKVKVSPFRRDVDIKAHYAIRKGVRGTDQFQDVCIAAGIRGEVDFRLDWRVHNTALVEKVRKGSRPVVAVLLPRQPFARGDGYGIELLPRQHGMQRVVDMLGTRLVMLGSGDAKYPISGIDLNLANDTSVRDLIDVASVVDGFVGYVSFFVPLAESLKKPALFVWARAGLESQHEFIQRITPEKIFHRDTSRAITDDCSEQETLDAVDKFLDEIAGRGKV